MGIYKGVRFNLAFVFVVLMLRSFFIYIFAQLLASVALGFRGF